MVQQHIIGTGLSAHIIEAACDRQREWIAKAGHAAKERNLHLCVENLFSGFEGKSIHPRRRGSRSS